MITARLVGRLGGSRGFYGYRSSISGSGTVSSWTTRDGETTLAAGTYRIVGSWLGKAYVTAGVTVLGQTMSGAFNSKTREAGSALVTIGATTTVTVAVSNLGIGPLYVAIVPV